DAEEGDVHAEGDAAVDGVGVFGGCDEEGGAAGRGPVDGLLEVVLIHRRRIGGEDVEVADGAVEPRAVELIGERGAADADDRYGEWQWLHKKKRISRRWTRMHADKRQND